MNNNIGEARRSYGLTTERGQFTQEDAARYFGVALSTYASWEQGVGKGLKGEQLIKIAQKYGVSTDYLLCRTDKPTYQYVFVATDDGERELTTIYESLDDETRAQLLDYARYLAGRQ